MATVIDALVVTLGLDPSKYNAGKDKFISGFRKSKDDAKNITSEMTEDERAAASQRTDIAKREAAERSEYAKRVGMAITKVRNEALALLGVFTAGMGIKNFIGSTISTQASLGRLSENLSMSATDLATWQLAAKNAGGSVEGMTSQLKESASAIANFKAGFGADSGMQFFFRMGGTTEDLKDGNSYLMARAKIVSDIYKTDRQRAAVVSQGMGLDAAQFNLYRLGPQGIEQRRQEQSGAARELAANSAQAEALRRKYDTATNKLESVGVSVVNAMMPAIDLVVDKIIELGNWVVQHKDEINSAVRAFIEGFSGMLGAVGDFVAKAFPQEVRDKAKASSDPVKTYMDAAHDALGDALTGKKKEAPMSSAENLAAQKSAVQAFEAKGYTRAQAVGMVANLNTESGMNPKITGDGGAAYGVAQWHGDRQARFKQQFGTDIKDSTLQQQLDFVDWELKNTHKKALEKLLDSKTPEAAADVMSRLYEIPKEADWDAARRSVAARSLYGTYGSPADSSVAVANAAQLPPQQVSNSTTTSTTSHETNINGPISIQTQATDGHGVMRDLLQSMGNMTLATQANTGLR